MKKIMVFDVPAESGGALTILKQYYEKAIKDTKNKWIFVVSTPDLADTKNVKILNYPWVKKSWVHRLYFDIFIAKNIVNKYKVDEVLSLQNVIIPNLNMKQTLYLHQSLPFVEKRYGIIKNFKFWVYQNIISRMIFKSIEKADKIIVQTEWIKDACLQRVNTEPKKFELKQPKVHIKVKKYYKQESDNFKLFFYPASALEYKNHRVIVEASQMLCKRGVTNFKIVLTLHGNEDNHIKTLYQRVKVNNLPIEFIGPITLEEVYEYYSKSILIFPSYIETFGLPLLEAKMHDAPILASDCAFSHEILNNYEKVKYFAPHDYVHLFNLMENIIADDMFRN